MKEFSREQTARPKDFGFEVRDVDRERGIVRIADGPDEYVVHLRPDGTPILRSYPGREEPSAEKKRALFSQAKAILEDARRDRFSTAS